MKYTFWTLILLIQVGLNIAYAQKYDPNHKLLWKISGKGLPKPSYMYGTMHVKDKRAFNFSDSVYLKIDECKYFALENHPDSMVKEFYVKTSKLAFLNKFNESQFGETKSESEKPVVKEFKKERINEFYSYRSDKNAIVDAHLYHIARLRKKNIIGLEQIQSSKKAFEKYKDHDFDNLETDEFKEIKKSAKSFSSNMIENYANGRIDFFNYLLTDSLNLSRNFDMFTAAQQYMSDGIFMAVGSAHLPGEGGLIDLFRKDGYTVEPVKANFTGLTKRLAWEKLPMPWVNNIYLEDGFQFETPTIAYDITPDDGFGLMKVMYSPDIGTGIQYMSMSVQNMTNVSLDEASKLFSGKVQEFKKSSIVYENHSGKEYVFVVGKYFQKFRLFTVGNKILFHGAISENDKFLKSESVNKYFNSLKFSDIPESRVESGEYVDSLRAFSVRTYIKPRFKRIVDNSIDPAIVEYSNVFMDHNKNMAYFISEYLYSNHSNYFADLKASMETALKDVSDTLLYFNDLNDGIGIEYQAQIEKNWILGKIIYLGSKLYEIRVAFDKEEKLKEASNFITSFKLEPQKSDIWTNHDFDNYSIKCPGIKRTSSDSQYDGSFARVVNSFSSQDTLNGNVYNIDEYILNPYFTIGSRDSILNYFGNHILNYRDTLFSKVSSKTEANGFYYVSRAKGVSHFHADHKFILCGDKAYHLSVYQDLLNLDTSVALLFFNDFKLRKTCDVESNFFLDSLSMKKLILKDMLALDTAAMNNGLALMTFLNWDQESLVLIANKITGPINSLGSFRESYLGTMLQILIDNNYRNIDEVVSKVITEINLDSETTSMLISQLLYTYKPSNYALVKKVFNLELQKPDHKELIFNRFYPLIDSIKYINYLLPDFIKWMNRDSFIFNANLVNDAIDNGIIKIEDISSYLPTINQFLSREFDRLSGMVEEDSYINYHDLAKHAELSSLFSPLVSKTKETMELLLASKHYWDVVNGIKCVLKSKADINFNEALDRIYNDGSAKYDLFMLQDRYKDVELLEKQDMHIDSFVVAKLKHILFEYEDFYGDVKFSILSIDNLERKVLYKISGYDEEENHYNFIVVINRAEGFVSNDAYFYYGIDYGTGAPFNQESSEKSFKSLVDNYNESMKLIK